MKIFLLSLLLACSGEEPAGESPEAADETAVSLEGKSTAAAEGTEEAGTEEAGTEEAGTEEAGTEEAGTEEAEPAKTKKKAASKPKQGRLIRVPIKGYAKTYYFSGADSEIYGIVSADRESFTASWSIDHVILAKEWIGSVRWNPRDISQCIFEFKFPVESLEVDGRDFRESLGLDLSITESERESITDRGRGIKRKMISSSLLDAENHPLIVFTSSQCKKTVEGLEVLGNLSIRGSKRQVLIGIDVNSDQGLSIRGRFNILHSDFGIDPYFGLEPHIPYRPVVVDDLIGFYFKIHSAEASK
jgi:hypothetical protein